MCVRLLGLGFLGLVWSPGKADESIQTVEDQLPQRGGGD